MSDTPEFVLPEVSAMQEDMALIDALVGGTKEMRAAGVKYMPKWPKEENTSYTSRLSKSTLFPAFSETVQNMTGRVFAEPIALEDSVPESVANLTDNIDNQGNSLNIWSKEWFANGLSKGITFALVEYPRAEGVRTVADEKRLNVRPYVVRIDIKQVLGWREEGGTLTQFRFKEFVSESEGEFGSKMVEQIRVLDIGRWRIYRKAQGGAWEQHDQGVMTLTVIPIVVYYTKRIGFMTATPPLLDLAYMNVKHWQSQSDQDNLLHVARVPIFVTIGEDETPPEPGTDDAKTEDDKTVGAGMYMRLPKDADAKYVEHSGEAIEAGRNSLKDMVEDMRMAGAKLIQPQVSSTKTATQADDDAANNLSPLETMAEGLQDALEQILQLFAMWQGKQDGGSVEVRGNFDIDYAPDVSLSHLMSMRNGGVLSQETLFKETQRRRVISDDVDWEEEKARIEAEGPNLGGL